ncbi:MAG: septum formation inhibitor Maf [Omnitrophica WOR_2 bacterium SM23_72]|nr:MAG: septum formation inhibitor Maf [Omnitrophica WOR_2 bacterium SM23_72]
MSISRPHRLVLASSSPRRRYLLEQAGLTFSVIPSTVDEGSAVRVSPTENHVRMLANAKALEVAELYPKSWIIGADTLVLIGDVVLGKPDTAAQARQMLRALSNKTHRVLTGYCICCKAAGRSFSETVETRVLFKPLSESEIDWYVNTSEPYDKAGGYAVQGLGTFMVKSIEGSYTNVVGLPVCEVIQYLLKEGVVKR